MKYLLYDEQLIDATIKFWKHWKRFFAEFDLHAWLYFRQFPAKSIIPIPQESSAHKLQFFVLK